MQWGATDKELVQSWMAFKVLLNRGLILFDIPKMYKPEMSPPDYGWKHRWGVCTDEYFLERILRSPEDFRLGHDTFGFDVVSCGQGCLNPGKLPRILAEHLGLADVETLFDSSEVAKEGARLAHARESRKEITAGPHCGKEI